MLTVTAKAKVGEDEVSASVQWNMGEDLMEMCDLYGEDHVYNAASANVTSQVQGVIRRGIKAGKSPDEIQALVDSWKPGVKFVIQKDPVQVLKDRIAALGSREEKEAMIAELQKALMD
jgi:hypothetical protein